MGLFAASSGENRTLWFLCVCAYLSPPSVGVPTYELLTAITTVYPTTRCFLLFSVRRLKPEAAFAASRCRMLPDSCIHSNTVSNFVSSLCSSRGALLILVPVHTSTGLLQCSVYHQSLLSTKQQASSLQSTCKRCLLVQFRNSKGSRLARTRRSSSFSFDKQLLFAADHCIERARSCTANTTHLLRFFCCLLLHTAGGGFVVSSVDRFWSLPLIFF